MMSRAGRHALVLAAGAGRRFGGNKLSALWGGEPLVLAALRSALAARVERVTVVTGAQAPALDPVLSTIDDPRLRRVVALDWNEGLAASLRAGVASLPGDTQTNCSTPSPAARLRPVSARRGDRPTPSPSPPPSSRI
jgi:CTP:molybdopterin cytidylyltransferase MocA